ncbi:hypothetical protein [Actinomadura harenae]|uniref:Core-binding (CB) domain-containing protein n=1 Tax=Actinomadura harenae TaxID=2483351 RepID=A0A3M2KZX8_9ACTN|nr:hypothetical protein [Actinomadura harenae]RMI30010.1 hypothetical protein EBO15_43140 [Actinomadura harenae]
MANAEQRAGSGYWRGRYRNPPGVRPKVGTISADRQGIPFTSEADALRAAYLKEAELHELAQEWDGPPLAPGSMTIDEWKRTLAGQKRARGERDRYAGQQRLADWVRSKWLPAQDIEPESVTVYDQHLRLRILPSFGTRPINTLHDREEVELWHKTLRQKYSLNTADNCRNLLSTILGDAQTAGLVDVNAAERRRRRGKVAQRRVQEARTPRQWVTRSRFC